MSTVWVRGSEATVFEHIGQARPGRIYPTRVSVLIASNLRKEFSGDPLFDGISFSVDRGQRLGNAACIAGLAAVDDGQALLR